MSASNDFESINLGLSSHLATRVATLHSVPDSTSGDEDDDDDDLDPEEFISPERTDTNVIDGITNLTSTINLKDQLQDSVPKFTMSNSYDTIRTGDFLSQDSLIGNSVVFPKEYIPKKLASNDDETPLEFISSRVKLLTQELRDNARKHESFLNSGNPNLYRIRSMIAQNYDQLSDGYYSLNELYSKDLSYTETLQSTFKKWDSRRTKVLGKISEIKSEKSKYGSKLVNLLHRSEEIDTEVYALEEKLKELKSKKEVINKEIQDTSSVLESKTAKYVDMFKSMEDEGRNAIVGFLQSHGIPDSEIHLLVKSAPVDVTFQSNYQDQRIRVSEVIPKKNPGNSMSKGVQSITHNPKSSSSLGIQAYVPPESPANLVVIPQDTREMNYGHGPTPYEKGYAKGAQNSVAVKKQIKKAMNALFESLPEKKAAKPQTKTPSVDDLSNTITNKLILDPISKFLDHKVEALSDLILQSSKKAALFHEFGTIWKNATKVLNLSEGKLSNTLNESTPDANVNPVVEILTSTLAQMKQCLESTRSVSVDNKDNLAQRDILENIVLIEIHGIIEGIKLVSRGTEYNDLLTEYENLETRGASSSLVKEKDKLN
ncbi:uncharacterized protein SPAPADRAFT_140868 [Spathaspora passalidarum NRRL Y-27907]|uniref:Autophagy-related protein 28 n=1 Tax=Spathaspora passalidarum (strain NRRL Y-27907 / 11-Y1) TaxID=619300 RepID=G3AQP5_SPAPN|nr:uncharacterized protein SPAPADRAFT_140868 [Spathaspora passalidarum NRRL Y-27907]EGW31592.1 hypothetical protein SPAPADRAFT_140868 [Spathaspora passalidarum NRRL Y-27907]